MNYRKFETPVWFNSLILIVIALMIIALAPMVREGIKEFWPDKNVTIPVAVPTTAPMRVTLPATQPTTVIATQPAAVPMVAAPPTQTPVVEIQPVFTQVTATAVIDASTNEEPGKYDPEFLLACWTARQAGRRVSPRCPGNEAVLLGSGR